MWRVMQPVGRRHVLVLLGTAAAAGSLLYFVQRYHYLLFHLSVELFAIVVAFSLSMVGWYSRRLAPDGYVLVLGTAFFCVGLVDAAHTLVFPGMGLVGAESARRTIEFWLIARLLQALGMALAPLAIGRPPIRPAYVVGGWGALTGLLLVTTLVWPGLPAVYVEGVGLTRFKIAAEYGIVLLFGLGAWQAYARRASMESDVRWLVGSAALLMIAGELAMTRFSLLQSFPNFLGHLFKFLAFHQLLRAVVETGFTSPHALLYRDLATSRNALARANEELEARISRRTAALFVANEHLRAEIGEREQAIRDLRAAEQALHQSEEQLRQVQKMEAVGQLAGGIAHDFNNILSVTLGYGEMALDCLPKVHPARAPVMHICEAVQRAAALTRQLLQFSRKQVLAPRVVDLCHLVAGFTDMLRRLIGERIDLVVRSPAEPLRVSADVGQIEQVLMNLVVNARDAMPEGGTITIELAAAHLDEEFVRSHPESATGPWVRLSVREAVTGMDDDTKLRVFEPFFTTKQMGRGVGLGLSTVYGIVRQHGGVIDVESQPGRGSTFHVWLPRATTDAPEETSAGDARATGFRRHETVLLVEDDPLLRDLVATMLGTFGCEVLVAAGAQAAMAYADRPGQRIDLLLTDVIMPGPNGRELFERLAARHPSLKVLYMSGYPADVIAHEGRLDPGLHFLPKPFSMADLRAKIDETLGAN